MIGNSVGLLETYGYVGAVIGLDTTLKTAEVTLIDYQLISGGLVTITIAGEVAAVQCALDSCREVLEAKKISVVTHVIPRISQEVKQVLYDKADSVSSCKEDTIGEKKVYENEDMKSEIDHNEGVIFKEELNNMKVEELRTLARKYKVTSIERNMIKFAKKKELIEAIILKLEGCEDR